MAKKKFDISSTLKKNKIEGDKVELAPKVPLRKIPKDLEDVKQKVEEIHNEEAAVPKEGKQETQEIKVEKSSSKPKKVSLPPKPRIVRMTIDTPEEIHLNLKIKSIQARMSMKDYVLRLIEKDLKKK